MDNPQWIEEFGGAITVCGRDGTIRSMNAKASEAFAQQGGKALIGRNLFDCHPPAAGDKIKDIMRQHATNCYTIEKNGIKKLIYQAPWYENGEYKGLVELSLPLPDSMPHFVRD